MKKELAILVAAHAVELTTDHHSSFKLTRSAFKTMLRGLVACGELELTTYGTFKITASGRARVKREVIEPRLNEPIESYGDRI